MEERNPRTSSCVNVSVCWWNMTDAFSSLSWGQVKNSAFGVLEKEATDAFLIGLRNETRYGRKTNKGRGSLGPINCLRKILQHFKAFLRSFLPQGLFPASVPHQQPRRSDESQMRRKRSFDGRTRSHLHPEIFPDGWTVIHNRQSSLGATARPVRQYVRKKSS